MTIHLHKGDLPAGIDFGASVAIDTEAMGLSPRRDRLCLAQLSAGDGDCHLVQFAPGAYQSPNLNALLVNPKVLKIFHFGRFDIAMMAHHLRAVAAPVYCTKIASKLARTFTDKHGLKDLCRELHRRRAVKTTADLGLGRADADRGPEALCRVGRRSISTRSAPSSTRS